MLYEVTVSEIENGWLLTVRRQDIPTSNKFFESKVAALVAAKVIFQSEIEAVTAKPSN